MRIKKAFIGVGAAALLLGGLAIPSAHAGSSLCPVSRVCVYSDINTIDDNTLTSWATNGSC